MLDFSSDSESFATPLIEGLQVFEKKWLAAEDGVDSVSMETWVRQHAPGKSDLLLQMDIEGAEYEIIKNLEDDIFDITDSFLIEWHDNTDGRVQILIDKLKEKGFNIEQIRNQNDKYNSELTFTYEGSKVGTFYAVKKEVDNLLTVIIPSHNHEQYIEECINSVINQKTLFNFQILISDDCSTDNTFGIIQKYKNYKNIKIEKTNSNEGPTPFRVYNLLKNINSEYVTMLDADDYYLDEYKLQKQIEFLKNNTDYSIHSTGHLIAAEDSWAYGYTDGLEHYHSSTMPEVSLKDNIDGNYVAFGFMFRNSLIKGIPFPNWFFDENVFDGYWAINNILLQYGKAKNEDWVSGRYRITKGGHFGEKDQNWKDEECKKQSDLYKKVFTNKANPILIVDAYFHDKQCTQTFIEYLTFIKKLDIPIMLVTNSNFDKSLLKDIDYLFYDCNNRLFQKKYDDIDNIVFWFCIHLSKKT
jgi:glycosyltransferase involved in cell wall biosynthesis